MKTDKTNFSIAIVAPLHIKPSDIWIRSIEVNANKADRKVIIVDDSAAQNIASFLPVTWDVYTRDRQKEELGDELYEKFKTFHRSSACRNFGHYIAWKQEYDIIIGIDSDCNVPFNFVAMHIEALISNGRGWTNPLENVGMYPRGFPYSERTRRIVANLGLWENELDLNGKDRIGVTVPKHPRIDKPHKVADGFLPFSGMNWAMWRDAIPGFMFLPNFDYEERWDAEKDLGTNGDGTKAIYQFRRHDDIWGGYIFQKLMEKKNDRMMYGEPIVFHDTIVNPEEDAEEEKAMNKYENGFLTTVDMTAALVEPSTYEDMFLQFTKYAEKTFKGEWALLLEPMKFFAEIFNQ